MSDYVSVHRVEPHPGNVRSDIGDLSELAESIRAQGILQPIVVQPHPKRRGCYVVLAGHRRLAAAKLAGFDEVPIEVRQAAGPDAVVVLMLVENCQRADLSPMDKAEAMGRLRKLGYSATRIAQATGLTASAVSYNLSLLELDRGSQERVRAGTVRASDAVAAVRQTRAGNRKAEGKPRRKTSVAAEHFSTAHPLAEDARIMCELAGHTARKYGKDTSTKAAIACGECWEAVIRRDDRRVRSASARSPFAAAGAS